MVSVKAIAYLGAGFAIGFIYGELTAPPHTERKAGNKPVKAHKFAQSVSWYYMNNDDFRADFLAGRFLQANEQQFEMLDAAMRTLFRADHSKPKLTLNEVVDQLRRKAEG